MNKREIIDLERVQRMMEFDARYDSSQRTICGMDEVGRGPLAGPVVVAGVVFGDYDPIIQVNDSKKMTQLRREAAFKVIQERAVCGIGMVWQEEIDRINILNATKKAFALAYRELCKSIQPDLLLLDYIQLDLPVEKVPIVNGDGQSYHIAAASVIAKVTRDKIMMDFDAQFPQYNFAKNKGYGTAEHMAAIKKYGPCELHRRSFLKNIL